MKTLISGWFLVGAVFLTSCGTSNSDSKEKADSANEALSDAAEQKSAVVAVDEDDAEFAVNAANGGITEVMLGELAQHKAIDPRVKEMGKAIVDDHTRVNDQLRALAARKDITLPAVPGEKMQKAIDDISKKSGKDFDKAYVRQMVDDHEKTIKLFEEGKTHVKDVEIRAFIEATLPVLRSHLELAERLKKGR